MAKNRWDIVGIVPVYLSSTLKINLSYVSAPGRAPPRNTMVDLNSGNIDVPPNMTSWPNFHNGVAAGLKIAPASQVSVKPQLHLFIPAIQCHRQAVENFLSLTLCWHCFSFRSTQPGSPTTSPRALSWLMNTLASWWLWGWTDTSPSWPRSTYTTTSPRYGQAGTVCI